MGKYKIINKTYFTQACRSPGVVKVTATANGKAGHFFLGLYGATTSFF